MTNKVHVKFFAILREYIGLKEDWREIESGITVQELWDQYTAQAKNPRAANIRAAFAVNQRLAKPETVLHGGEEIGFLPPVSGGAGTRKKTAARKTTRKPIARARIPKKNASLSRAFVITKKPLSLDSLVARVSHPGAGAIATFLGVVRDNAHDKQVKFLEYEAYPELAERMLAQIGAEAQERWSDVRIAIAHRTGRLKIGEASVIIAVSAPHRAETFAACRYAIERLKVIVPVWKKEFASDTDYWVEGPTPGDVPTEEAEETVRAQEAALAPAPSFGVLSVSDEGDTASRTTRNSGNMRDDALEGGEIRADVESV